MFQGIWRMTSCLLQSIFYEVAMELRSNENRLRQKESNIRCPYPAWDLL